MDISEGRAHPLGAAYDGEGTNFSVFSSVARKVELCLFDGEKERRFPLPGRTGPIWHGYLPSVGPDRRYGFRVDGPWDPAQGHMCSSDKLLLDPYAKAVDGAVRWNDSLFPYDPGTPAFPRRGDSAPYMPRSVVIDTRFDWKDDRPPGTRLEDTVIYEVHLKGFTIRHPDIPPELRGTYAGFAHEASVDHLRRLGITAVELLPVHQFIHRREFVGRGLVNYWGYDPVCCFAPHNDYARDRHPGGAVAEFKGMVRTLHSAGLEVILDVVFNHTGEGGVEGPVLGFKGLDNAAYYRLTLDSGLKYIDNTGTKNTLNSEHPQVRQMIVDSLRYWVTEMHVDGFRLDLAPAIAREGCNINFGSAFFDAVRSDPALCGVKLIAEPWDLGDDGYQLGRFPRGWSEWNDRYRDGIRCFWNRASGTVDEFALRFAGSPDIYGPGGRTPQASVNFVTCHDGFTLHDLVSYDTKHNEANGEENHDGGGDNHSSNFGVEGLTDNGEINALRARQKRNFLVTLLLSQGVPMLLGGDELGRTQRGNNNAYCQDNEISWLDWERADASLVDFVRLLVGLRKREPAFHRKDWPLASGGESPSSSGLVWYDAHGREMPMGKGTAVPPKPIQVLIAGGGNGASGTKGPSGTKERSESGDDLLVMFNPSDGEAVFNLPQPLAGRQWLKIVDTSLAVQLSSANSPKVSGPALTARSVAILASDARDASQSRS